jgi:1,4-alpha-glucan branching enzyme
VAKKSDIEFVLFAPYNEYAALAGSWNNWDRIPMKKGNDGYWRVSVPLNDGDYEYKFVVKSKSYFVLDREVMIADPYSVRWDQDDQNSCLTIRNGQRVLIDYQWKHDDKPLPPNDALILYELNIGDFTGGPDGIKDGKTRLQKVIEKLDYIADLGINGIELMPVTEFPGTYSWGYTPLSYFAVESGYGSPEDLCQLIDESHARGIRVFFDGVFNHTNEEAPLTKIDYTYWYHKDNPDDMYFGPKLDYEHFDENLKVWPARKHICEAIFFWLQHFHIDGIRFDATRFINQDVLRWLHTEIFKSVPKPFYTVAENVPQDPSVTGPDGPLDAAWHENFSKQLMCTIVGVPKDGHEPFNLDNLIKTIDPRTDGFMGAFNVVNYIDNHDQDRIMWQIGHYGNTFDEAAFRRIKMGAAILLTAPGAPMIFMGQEFGESAPRTLDPQPLDWELLDNQSNRDLWNYYKGLLHLRRSNQTLQGNNFEIVYGDRDRSLLSYKRWDDAGGIVVVVANLKGENAGQISIPNWPGDGKWHEYIYNYDVDIHDCVLNDTLAESEVKIYIKQ